MFNGMEELELRNIQYLMGADVINDVYEEMVADVEQVMEDVSKIGYLDLIPNLTLEYQNQVSLPSTQDWQVLPHLLNHIQSLQLSHKQTQTNLQSKIQSISQQYTLKLNQSQHLLLEAHKSLSIKQAQICLLKQDRLELKEKFNLKERQLENVNRELREIIQEMEGNLQKEKGKKQEWEKEIEEISKELSSMDIQGHYLGMRSMAVRVLEHECWRREQIYDMKVLQKQIVKWQNTKEQTEQEAHSYILNVLSQASVRLNNVSLTIEDKNKVIQRQKHKIRTLKTQNKVLKSKSISQAQRIQSLLKCEQQQQQQPNNIQFEIVEPIHFNQISVQTEQTSQSIQYLHLSLQQSQLSMTQLQQEIISFTSSLSESQKKLSSQQLLHTNTATALSNKIMQLELSLQQSLSLNTQLEATIAELSLHNKKLIEHQQQVEEKIELVERNLSEVQEYNMLLEDKLKEQKMLMKEFEEEIGKAIKQEREEYERQIEGLKEGLKNLEQYNIEVKRKLIEKEQEVERLRKEVIRMEQNSLASYYSKREQLRGSISNHSHQRRTSLEETVKLTSNNHNRSPYYHYSNNDKDKQNSKSSLNTPLNYNLHTVNTLNQKLQNFNEIINYMINYSKGYNFEGQVKVRRGCWIEGQSKEIIGKVLERENIQRKYENWRRVRELAREDEGTRELVKSFEKIMGYYFS